MNWLRSIFSKPGEEDCPIARLDPSLTTTLTGRLPSPGPRIVLRTAENTEIYLTRQDVSPIKSLMRMINDLEVDKNGDMTLLLPLNLSADQMSKILAWTRSDLKDIQLLSKIFGQNVKELLKFIEFSQFLDISQLSDQLSQHVSDLLGKMTIDEMRKALDRENKPPCTEEQLKAVEELKSLLK